MSNETATSESVTTEDAPAAETAPAPAAAFKCPDPMEILKNSITRGGVAARKRMDATKPAAPKSDFMAQFNRAHGKG
jgi:hypothetical protein